MRKKTIIMFMLPIFALVVILRGENGKAIELVDDPTLNNIKKNTGWWRANSTNLCKQISPGRGRQGNCLSIWAPDKNSSGAISWQYNTAYKPSFGQGKLCISFWVRTENVKSLKPENIWASPYFMLIGHIDKNGKKEYENFKGIQTSRGTSEWTEYKMDFTLPENTLDLAGVFRLQNCTGKIWIDDFSMKFIPASESNKKKAIRIKVMGGKEMNLLYAPRNDKADLPLKNISQKDEKRGFIIFHRENPRDLYPYSVPQPDEITTSVNFFATPGEQEPTWIGIYALENLKNFKIQVSDLKSDKGDIISKEHIRIFHVKCWPQGSTVSAAGDDSSYSIIPEILIEKNNIDISTKTSQNFYFLVKIPEHSKPGFYRAKITAGTQESGLSEVNLIARVLPFKLTTPTNMTWFIHTTGNFNALCDNGKTPLDAATEACQDMKAHGIEGISIGCGYGSGTIKLQKNEGKLQISSFSKIETLIPAMKNAGMKGPIIIHFGDILEYQVAKAMNFELPQTGQKGGVNNAMRTPEFENAFKDAIREVDALVKKLGGDNFKWRFEGVDEPGGHSARQERALWEWRLAKEAKIQGAAYMHGPFWKKLAPYNYIQIFSAKTFYDKTVTEKLQLELKEANNVAFQYGASGTYGPLPGGLMPSRWGVGFFAYNTKIKGQISWLYSFHKKIDPEGLEHMSFYPLIAYVTSENGLSGTLQWEGIREGIDDYRFISTLDKLIEKAKGHETLMPKAFEIENKLQQLLNVVPWIEDYSVDDSTKKVDMSEFDNRTVAKLRWQIALWIMDLNSTLNEGGQN